MKEPFIKIHPKDNVLVALKDLSKGENISIDKHDIELQETVKAKHKFLITSLKKGDDVLMYGVTIGIVNRDLPSGALLTTENILHKTDNIQERQANLDWQKPDISKYEGKTFKGFHRSCGQVGTANYWVVMPLVFCENANVEKLKDAFLEELGFEQKNKYKKVVRQLVAEHFSTANGLNLSEEEGKASPYFKNLDGIKFLTHQGGCGGTREDSEMLCGLIAGYLNNPNVAGGTILSLGCQNAQIDILKRKLKALNPNFDKPLHILEQQQEGTEEALLNKAISKTFEGLLQADKQTRQPAPLSKLNLGLECGGSDGFSGISANPALGYASDILVALGGKSMLSEFPELCGVEQELINRCTTDEHAEKFKSIISEYAKAAVKSGSGFDMNPSPGNIKDGLITDAMKSAGAAKKGGTSPITDVLDYTEYANKPGLNLLCTPGNDVESTTGLAGSGANIIVFTTGLGTPTGNPIVPVVKMSSNSDLAKRMPDIIDIDAGEIIEGTKTIEEMGEDLLDFIIEVASGNQKTKSQLLHQNDFIPWKRGISL
jgi:altronate hydrolase